MYLEPLLKLVVGTQVRPPGVVDGVPFVSSFRENFFTKHARQLLCEVLVWRLVFQRVLLQRPTGLHSPKRSADGETFWAFRFYPSQEKFDARFDPALVILALAEKLNSIISPDNSFELFIISQSELTDDVPSHR
jgi:hypothetical protein